MFGFKSSQNARSIETVFEDLQLPMPQRDDYRCTRDGGKILFLSRYGATVRITPQERSIGDVTSRFFLKPLFTIAAEDYDISINPGIESPVALSDVKKIMDVFREGALRFCDAGVDNLGYVPGTNRESVVILDTDAETIEMQVDWFKNLTNSVEKIKPLLEKIDAAHSGTPDPQDIYTPLRRAIKEAWPQDAEHPDPSKINDFWEECITFRQAGKLCTSWKENRMGEYAIKYEERLKSHTPSLQMAV